MRKEIVKPVMRVYISTKVNRSYDSVVKNAVRALQKKLQEYTVVAVDSPRNADQAFYVIVDGARRSLRRVRSVFLF